jgi:hypothetical protein
MTSEGRPWRLFLVWGMSENRQTRIHERFKIGEYVEPRPGWGEKHMRRWPFSRRRYRFDGRSGDHGSRSAPRRSCLWRVLPRRNPHRRANGNSSCCASKSFSSEESAANNKGPYLARLQSTISATGRPPPSVLFVWPLYLRFFRFSLSRAPQESQRR